MTSAIPSRITSRPAVTGVSGRACARRRAAVLSRGGQSVVRVRAQAVSHQRWLANSIGLALGIGACMPFVGDAYGATPVSIAPAAAAYEQAVQTARPRVRSNLPGAAESFTMMSYPRDMFTDDAWEGMQTIQTYAELLESVQEEEKMCGEECIENRILLEKVWQVVANEFYDVKNNFSQASWAKQLLLAFQSSGGVVKSGAEAHRLAREMVASLGDPYSAFLEPSEYRKQLRKPQPKERAYLEAQYTGLGIGWGALSPEGGRLVDAVLPGSPAEAAGLRRNDRVLNIDGYALDGLSLQEATTLSRGLAGTSVDILVAHDTQDQGPHVVMQSVASVKYRELPLPPVRVETIESTGSRVLYMRVHYFSSGAVDSVAKAVANGESEGVEGYILDLRNDPGGVFEDAIALSSLFLDDGKIAVETQRSDDAFDNIYRIGTLSSEIFPSLPGQLTTKPLVILTNRSSASASEVLTGALQGNGRAVVVGERTFGKGVVQYFFPTTDGSGLKLTVFKYVTPDGKDITAQGGLIPDRACSATPTGVFGSYQDLDECIKAGFQEIILNRPAH